MTTTRRSFVKSIAYAGAALPVALPRLARAVSPNEKLNIAFVATGGKAKVHVNTIAKFEQNCPCYCDVDTGRQSDAAKHWPEAKAYQDYRRMFDAHGAKDIDAVFVTTPDHHHYPASMLALQQPRPIHLYVQKPLTWSVWEARKLTEAAAKRGVATQMGNQGHAGEGWRITIEWIRSGAIGECTEVHTWTDRPIWPQGLQRPEGSKPVPATLDWDAWIGPAPMRPYHDNYHPFKWRGVRDFGAGALGDMGCHVMDGFYWGLEPGHPTSVEPIKVVDLTDDCFPNKSIIKWTYPAKKPGGKPIVHYWYDGGLKPPVPESMLKDGRNELPTNGSLFVGSKASILASGWGGQTTRITPEATMQEVGKPPQLLDRAPQVGPMEDNHHWEFILAARGEKPANFPGSNFAYAGPLTETVLLGNVALLAGTKLEWDAKSLRVTNNERANDLIYREPRKRWKFDDGLV